MRIFTLLLLAILLAGCTEMPVSPVVDDRASDKWELRRNTLSQLHAWTLQGRLVIYNEKEGWSAKFHWVQKDDNYSMRFIAPLGQGTYELNGGLHNVSLVTADNRFLQARDPESLLQDNLGWRVPLTGLKYWVRGLPAPDTSSENLMLDEQGRITDLHQSGWEIRILRYSDVEGIDLPEKIFMQNDRFKLRLVIQDWKTKAS